MRFVKQNTAFTHAFGPFVASTDGVTPVSGITPVTTDWRISKNGGSLLTKSSATTTIYLESGYYQVAFSSSDVDTVGHMKAMITLTSAGGALPVWDEFWVSESSEIAAALTTAGRNALTTAMWAEAYASHTTAGTYGAILGANLLTPTSAAVLSAAGVQAITTGIWAEPYASHTTAGSLGNAIGVNLLSPTSGVTMLAASQTALVTAVTTSVWAEALASHTTAGGAGKKLIDISLTTVPDPWSIALPGAYTTNQGGGIMGNVANNLISPTSGITMLAASQTALITAVTTAVWAEALASHTTAGGAGNTLTAAGSAGDPWQTALPGAYTTAQAGGIVSTIRTASSAIQAKTVNLPATPASSTDIKIWAMSTDMASIITATSQIQAKTTNLPAVPAGSSHFTNLMTSTGSTAMADAIWLANSEATESYGGQIRLIRAGMVGLSTGGGTASISFYSPTTTIIRIVATVTTDGNRTAVAVTT
jgi:hypothetical protein